jgi:hypothetical protein
LLSACGGEDSVQPDNENETTGAKRERAGRSIKAGRSVTEADRQKVQMLISTSKMAMDSIDVTYKSIRSSSKLLKLTAEERESVNEALQNLNVLKELIILETQSAVIQQLKEKTTELYGVMDEMSSKSDKLNEIAAKIGKVSGIVKKTTDALAAALSSGIIRPRMVADPASAAS